MKIKGRYIFIAAIVLILGITIYDLVRISGYRVIPMRPKERIDTQQDQIYYELTQGERAIDWNRLEGTLEYIDKQYDCSDFRLVNLIRILYEYEQHIPGNTLGEIEHTLFNFRYWWDEPEENSMCYWSENHQILFASAEYLAGQRYPDRIFPNSGLTGREHRDKARKRIMDWLEMRWKYGFIEFNSEVYYKEDIGALINLIDFAKDEELVIKSMIIMDVLFYDVAVQNIGNMFISVSGRAYEGNRKGGPGATLGGLTNYLWGNGKEINAGMMYGMMRTGKYKLPRVLAEIARDTNRVIIKQNNGLDVGELQREGFSGTDNRSMMMQWGMEAFTNHEIIGNSLQFIRQHRMFSNEFLKDFRNIDITLVRLLGLESFLSWVLNPQSNGVAIQRGNTYTFKTPDYSLYSVQKYHPGTYGDQQHVAGMNIANHFSIFHAHPALEKGVKNQSPSYWVGYGHLPHVAQDKNISMAIYHIPEKLGLMEAALLDYTHAYFPTESFDTTIIQNNHAFGKKGNTYCAMIALNKLELRESATDDLIQPGKKTFWIIEAGSKEADKSFNLFRERILTNRLEFDDENLMLFYVSRGAEFRLEFNGDFEVNGEIMDLEYDRYDSPYCHAPIKPETITVEIHGKSLHLDFNNLKREIVE